MEAASGFEPLNGGFADLSLNHLGTPPCAYYDPSGAGKLTHASRRGNLLSAPFIELIHRQPDRS